MSRNTKPGKIKANLDTIEGRRIAKKIRFNSDMAHAIMYLRKAQAECDVGRGLEGVVKETLAKSLSHLQMSLIENYNVALASLCKSHWSVIEQAIKLVEKPTGKRVPKKKRKVKSYKLKRSIRKCPFCYKLHSPGYLNCLALQEQDQLR